MPTRIFDGAWLNDNRILPGTEGGTAVVEWNYTGEHPENPTWNVIFRHDGAFWRITYKGDAGEVEKGVARWNIHDDITAVCIEPIVVPALQWHTMGRPRKNHQSTTSLNAAVTALADENRRLREDMGRLRFALGAEGSLL